MHPQRCSKADFDFIVTHLADFWGDESRRHLHHPMLINEFGDSAFVLKDGNEIVAYLFGFLSQTEPTGYVHVIAVREGHRQRALARQLYAHFADYARDRGCTALKAITSPGNLASIAFHRRLGMDLLGEPDADGVPVTRDYAGPGLDRVVFRLRL